MTNELGPGFCGTCGDTFTTTAALNAHQSETGHEMDQSDHPLRQRADFFQAGQTYQRRRWIFQCLAVATAPWDGEIRAAGFLIRTDGTGVVHGMTPEDWGHGGWVLAPAVECTGCGRTVSGRGLVRDEHDPKCPRLDPPF